MLPNCLSLWPVWWLLITGTRRQLSSNARPCLCASFTESRYPPPAAAAAAAVAVVAAVVAAVGQSFIPLTELSLPAAVAAAGAGCCLFVSLVSCGISPAPELLLLLLLFVLLLLLLSLLFPLRTR